MRRREFVTLLGGVAAWPLTARAQQPKVPVIGLLNLTSVQVTDFRNGLKEAGFIEGQNVSVAFRRPSQGPTSIYQAVRELADAQVAVIVVFSGYDMLLSVKAAASTTPIAYMGGVDLVKDGFADSLNHPGGNLTGIALLINAWASKRLDLLLKLVPEVTTVGYLIEDPDEGGVDQLSTAAHTLGRQIIVLECHTGRDIDRAFATIAQERVGALIVGASPVLFSNHEAILTLAADNRIPTIYSQPIYVREGGLMSYSPVGEARQLAVQYVARILSE
jgi:putative ABC transport system substrate-binding protein